MPKRNDPSHSLKRFAAILEEYELQYRSARGPAKKGPVVASLIDALSKGMQDKGLTPPPRNDLEDKIKNWYNNHKAVEKSGQEAGTGDNGFQSLGIGKKWNMRSVVLHECKDEIHEFIKETIGDVNGGPTYIKQFQRGVSAYIQSLTAEEKDQYAETAKQWNLQGPDRDEKRELAEKRGPKYIDNFLETTRLQLGMSVVLLGSWERPDGTMRTMMFQTNRQAHEHLFSDEQKALVRTFTDRWMEYAKLELEVDINEDDEDNDDDSDSSKPYTVEVNDDGDAILPPYNPNLKQKGLQYMIREYVAWHWKSIGGKHVPWTAISERTSEFIDTKYLPSQIQGKRTFVFCDPSRWNAGELKRLWMHWQDRQKRNKIPFAFQRFALDSMRDERESTGDEYDEWRDHDVSDDESAVDGDSRSEGLVEDALQANDNDDTEGQYMQGAPGHQTSKQASQGSRLVQRTIKIIHGRAITDKTPAVELDDSPNYEGQTDTVDLSIQHPGLETGQQTVKFVDGRLILDQRHPGEKAQGNDTNQSAPMVEAPPSDPEVSGLVQVDVPPPDSTGLSARSKDAFLRSLSQAKEWQSILKAVAKIPDDYHNDSRERHAMQDLEFTDVDVEMREEFHVGGAFKKFLDWLSQRPYTGKNDMVASRDVVYNILLPIGRLLRDIWRGQFSDEFPTAPAFIVNSALTWDHHQLLLNVCGDIENVVEEFIMQNHSTSLSRTLPVQPDVRSISETSITPEEGNVIQQSMTQPAPLRRSGRSPVKRKHPDVSEAPSPSKRIRKDGTSRSTRGNVISNSQPETKRQRRGVAKVGNDGGRNGAVADRPRSQRSRK